MKAAIKCDGEINRAGGTERDRGVKSVVDHQFCAANLPLSDFKRPIVVPTIPNRARQYNPAEQGLRTPGQHLVEIRTHSPAVSQGNISANHEVGDFAERDIGPLYLPTTSRAAAAAQAVANVHIEKRREQAEIVFKAIVKIVRYPAGAESFCSVTGRESDGGGWEVVHNRQLKSQAPVY